MPLSGALTNNDFLLSGAVSTLILFLSLRPSAKELSAAVLAGIALFLCLPSASGGLYHEFLTGAACVAAAALAITATAALRRPFQASKWRPLLTAAMPAAFALCSVLALYIVNVFTPYTLDAYLYAFDDSLGFQPGFWVGHVLAAHVWLDRVSRLAYGQLPLLLTLSYIAIRRSTPSAARDLLRLTVALGIGGFAIYFLFPAVGSPEWLASRFPESPPPMSALTLSPVWGGNAARNCMPSLHTAWVLGAWWVAAPRLRVLYRFLLGTAIVLVLIYTLRCHYLIDMIVAVPFTIAVYAAIGTEPAWRRSTRLSVCALGSAQVALWVLALRFGVTAFGEYPALAWTALALTLVACDAGHRRLWNPALAPRSAPAAARVTFSDRRSTVPKAVE